MATVRSTSEITLFSALVLDSGVCHTTAPWRHLAVHLTVTAVKLRWATALKAAAVFNKQGMAGPLSFLFSGHTFPTCARVHFCVCTGGGAAYAQGGVLTCVES